MKDLKTKHKRTFFVGFCAVFMIAVVLLVLLELLMKRSVLPNDPNQTLIDGELGILTVLGSTYAIKKLREKSDFLECPTFYIFSESYSTHSC